MAKEEGRITEVKIGLIKPDPNQPRKNFNPERMAELIASIRKYGIMTPLIVEEHGDGSYMLEDGERRYRAAKEIGLAKVPVVVRDAVDETERLIRQFHIQEQHEGWSANEKAVAVSNLAGRLGVSVKALANMLALPTRTVSDYTAFAELLDKDSFIKNETPIKYAAQIVGLRKFVKKTYTREEEKDFTQDMEEQFERAISARIKKGDIRMASDITKIRDAVKAKPKSALSLIKDVDMTVNEMFLKTDAKKAYAYRNLLSSSRSVAAYSRHVTELGATSMLSDSDRKELSRAKDSLAAVLNS